MKIYSVIEVIADGGYRLVGTYSTPEAAEASKAAHEAGEEIDYLGSVEIEVSVLDDAVEVAPQQETLF